MQKVTSVVIAGGGTAGWITAATLASQLGSLLNITLIESPDVGTIGVGEATIPTHKTFHQLIGVDEQTFMRETQATFKLGIEFSDWGKVGERYFHSFGQLGRATWMGGFQHLWQQGRREGWASTLEHYSLESQAAIAGKFSNEHQAKLQYAYHLDAGLYADFLSRFSKQRNVKHISDCIKQVQTCPQSGDIISLELASGQRVKGDLFIDCTGFKGLLIHQALNVGFEDWSHWLPMNSAWAVQTDSKDKLAPYTQSRAHQAGWQWQIPLQHRLGNGFVYSNNELSKDEAYHLFLRSLRSDMLSEPRHLAFTTGKRQKSWSRNCIAIGLSSGFLEPLESTSIHLSQIAATRLVQFFPFNGCTASLQEHFNAHVEREMLSIRDFIILHYHVNRRSDPFWRKMASMTLPSSLAQRIKLYKETSVAYQNDDDLFRVDSWNQVMLGQGIEISGYHHMGRLAKRGSLQKAFQELETRINQIVNELPSHLEFVNKYRTMK